jgi:hypothetical protein
MDRDALVATLPDNAVFSAMSPYQRKTTVEDFVEAVLEAIEVDGREPDDWETGDLAAALGFIGCHWYHAGLAAAERALTPPEQRSPLAVILPAGALPMLHLRKGLASVRLIPAPAV